MNLTNHLYKYLRFIFASTALLFVSYLPLGYVRGTFADHVPNKCTNKINIWSIFGRDIAASYVRPTLPQRYAKLNGAKASIGWLPGPSIFIKKNKKLTQIQYDLTIKQSDSIDIWLIDEFSRRSLPLNKYGSELLASVAKKYPDKKFIAAINYVDRDVINVLTGSSNIYFAPLLMTIKSTNHSGKRASISKEKARSRLVSLRRHVHDKQIVPVIGMFFPEEKIYEKHRLKTFESDLRFFLDEWVENGEYLIMYNNQNEDMLVGLCNFIDGRGKS